MLNKSRNFGETNIIVSENSLTKISELQTIFLRPTPTSTFLPLLSTWSNIFLSLLQSERSAMLGIYTAYVLLDIYTVLYWSQDLKLLSTLQFLTVYLNFYVDVQRLSRKYL